MTYPARMLRVERDNGKIVLKRRPLGGIAAVLPLDEVDFALIEKVRRTGRIECGSFVDEVSSIYCYGRADGSMLCAEEFCRAANRQHSAFFNDEMLPWWEVKREEQGRREKAYQIFLAALARKRQRELIENQERQRIWEKERVAFERREAKAAAEAAKRKAQWEQEQVEWHYFESRAAGIRRRASRKPSTNRRST